MTSKEFENKNNKNDVKECKYINNLNELETTIYQTI